MIYKVEQSIAIHFGTFKLSDEAYDYPSKHLTQALTKHNLHHECFKVLDHGESLIVASQKKKSVLQKHPMLSLKANALSRKQ